MTAADYRLLTEATGVRIAEALEDVTAMVGPKGDPGDVSEAELTAKLADKASAIVDTASGAIASFPDGAAVAAKDITIGIEPMQSGSGDPSPTNVRPISGWTGANVTRTGKNLFNKNNLLNGAYSSDANHYFIPHEHARSFNLPVKAGEIVTISGMKNWGVGYVNCFIDSSLNYISTVNTRSSIGGYAQSVTTEVPTGAKYLSIACYEASSQSDYELYDDIDTIQVEIGLASTPYEPYTGTTYPISWQSSAGTVYGGTLDVTTGVLTVDRAMVIYDGTENYVDYGSVIVCNKRVPKGTTVNGTDIIVSHCLRDELHFSNNGLDSVQFSKAVFMVDDVEELKAYLQEQAANGTPLQYSYNIATPQTYQLTPTDVALLLGDNNVWADTGDSTVTYRADTKLYIQKINAPTDDDMIADAQIASGKYFIVGGNLYKSTTTIPAGDAINPGSNCILTNLADALNALNT